MGRLIVVTGGSRSGKSAYAEELVQAETVNASQAVAYIATGRIVDDDFARRVKAHRLRRPADWLTVEEPLELDKAIQGIKGTHPLCLVDGVGTWVTNIMYKNFPQPFAWGKAEEEDFLERLNRLLKVCKAFPGTLLFVADEVGMGVIPDHREGRIFRDLNGLANQKIAAAAQEVYLVVCGIPMRVK